MTKALLYLRWYLLLIIATEQWFQDGLFVGLRPRANGQFSDLHLPAVIQH